MLSVVDNVLVTRIIDGNKKYLCQQNCKKKFLSLKIEKLTSWYIVWYGNKIHGDEFYVAFLEFSETEPRHSNIVKWCMKVIMKTSELCKSGDFFCSITKFYWFYYIL